MIILDPTLTESIQGSNDRHTDLHFCINPFNLPGLAADTADVYAQLLAHAFTAMLGDGNQSLSLQMTTLLHPCLRVLVERPGSTLFDLQRFMLNHTNEDLVEWGSQKGPKAHRRFFRELFCADGYAATRHSVATKCQHLLNSEWCTRLLASGKSTINLFDALNSGKKIVVNLAKGKVGGQTGQALGRFLVAMIAGAAFSRHRQPRSARVPIHLFIDECHTVISEDLQTILTETRKFGLHLTLAQQFVGQGMDRHLREAVLTNSGVKVLDGRARTNRASLSTHFQLPPDEFPDLLPGSFLAHVGGRNVRITLPRRSLGHRQSVSQ
ncbi:hypothetical protein SCOR_27380 [Sulfidibacter corallicola]|uniref:TraD/TraG TraM recognition site domain-containing protein n=1 Tax=Sulfidibacter corallicola TaxID=2818388 RepID=A0A8A4TND8_SULCO|nr:type IV secretory system conjugative DNA transfer family protein [Sulfidibacter corallicola]QTD50724.1 hypothetical protein J3U87_34495 [Sulfidibacter corallicola]